MEERKYTFYDRYQKVKYANITAEELEVLNIFYNKEHYMFDQQHQRNNTVLFCGLESENSCATDFIADDGRDIASDITTEIFFKELFSDLTEKEKKIVSDYFIMGKQVKETAAELGISTRQVSRDKNSALANAKKSGLEVDTVILSPMSHAGYYPGGKVMTMKVVFEKDTYRLLGAQIIGYEGVDKRIDVLATAIHAGLKATQLKDLDLAYAPPYSSAKDPVNMAGFMIDNIAKGTLKQWHLEDMDKISKDKSVVLLDVRTVGEFNRGHMDGFRNIPVDELRERINEIEKGKPVYLICQSGLRSYIASRILEGNGYETYNFSGGFRFYDAVVNDRALIERAYACGMDY